MSPQRLRVTLALLALPACGGPGTPPSPPPTPTAQPEAHTSAKPVPGPGADKVFDENGPAPACAPPKAECPEATPRTAFLDRCRLAGFRVRQCGCEQRCTGDVSALGRHYDADGHPLDCSPARADCTPPQASAAFQDACTERGFRLEVCGCEWLCSGDFKKKK